MKRNLALLFMAAILIGYVAMNRRAFAGSSGDIQALATFANSYPLTGCIVAILLGALVGAAFFQWIQFVENQSTGIPGSWLWAWLEFSFTVCCGCGVGEIAAVIVGWLQFNGISSFEAQHALFTCSLGCCGMGCLFLTNRSGVARP